MCKSGGGCSSQRQQLVPSLEVREAVSLKSEEVRNEAGEVRKGQIIFQNSLAWGKDLARLAAGISLVNSSPEKDRKNHRSDSAQPLRAGTGNEHLGKATAYCSDLWGHSPGKPSWLIILAAFQNLHLGPTCIIPRPLLLFVSVSPQGRRRPTPNPREKGLTLITAHCS